MRLNLLNMNRNKNALKMIQTSLMVLLFVFLVLGFSLSFTVNSEEWVGTQGLEVAQAVTSYEGDAVADYTTPTGTTAQTRNYYTFDGDTTANVDYDLTNNKISYDVGTVYQKNFYYSSYTANAYNMSKMGSLDMSNISGTGYYTSAFYIRDDTWSNVTGRKWYSTFLDDYEDKDENDTSDQVAAALDLYKSGVGGYGVYLNEAVSVQDTGHACWNSCLNVQLPSTLRNYGNAGGTYTITLSGKLICQKEYSFTTSGYFFLGYKTSSSMVTIRKIDSDYIDEYIDSNITNSNLFDCGNTQITFATTSDGGANGYYFGVLNVGATGAAAQNFGTTNVDNSNIRISNYHPCFLEFSVDIPVTTEEYLAICFGASSYYNAGRSIPRAAIFDLNITAKDFTATTVNVNNTSTGYDYSQLSLTSITKTNKVNTGAFSTGALTSVDYSDSVNTTKTTSLSFSNPFSYYLIIPKDIKENNVYRGRNGYRFLNVSAYNGSYTLGYNSTNDNGNGAYLIGFFPTTTIDARDNFLINGQTASSYTIIDGDAATDTITKASYKQICNSSGITINSTARKYTINFFEDDTSSSRTATSSQTFDVSFTMPKPEALFTRTDNAHGTSWSYNNGEKLYSPSSTYVNLIETLNTNIASVSQISLVAIWVTAGAGVDGLEIVSTYHRYLKDDGTTLDWTTGSYDLYADLKFQIKAEKTGCTLVGVYARYESGDIYKGNGNKELTVALEETGTRDDANNHSYWILYGICGNCTLYPVWQANTYSITWNIDTTKGSVSSKPSYYTYGIGVSLFDMPMATPASGYAFLGWSVAHDDTTDTFIPTTATGTVTCTALWNATGNFYVTSGSVSNASVETVTSGSASNKWSFQSYNYSHEKTSDGYEAGTQYSSDSKSGAGYYLRFRTGDDTASFFCFCPVYFSGELYRKLVNGLVTASVTATGTIYVGAQAIVGMWVAGTAGTSAAVLSLSPGTYTNVDNTLTYDSDNETATCSVYNSNYDTTAVSIYNDYNSSWQSATNTNNTPYTTPALTIDSSNCTGFTIVFKADFTNNGWNGNHKHYAYVNGLSYTVSCSDGTTYTLTINTEGGTSFTNGSATSSNTNLNYISNSEESLKGSNPDAIINPTTTTGYESKGVVGYVPSGYTRVDYIQSSGTQWINTGITVKAGDKLVYEFDWISGYSIGQNDQATTGNPYFQGGDGIGANFTGFSISQSGRVRTMTFSSVPSPFNGVVGLCCTSYNTPLVYGSIKIYQFQYWHNGLLTKYFVPCVRDDGVVGLYECVNKVFYTNAGTGTFTYSGGLPIVRRSETASYTSSQFTGWVGLKSDTWSNILSTTTLGNNVTNYIGSIVYFEVYISDTGKYARFALKLLGYDGSTITTNNLGWGYEGSVFWEYGLNRTYYTGWAINNYPHIIYDVFTDGTNYATTIKNEWYLTYNTTTNYNNSNTSTTSYAANNLYPKAGSKIDVDSEYSGFHSPTSYIISGSSRGNNLPSFASNLYDRQTITSAEYATTLTAANACWTYYIWTLDSISNFKTSDEGTKTYDGEYWNLNDSDMGPGTISFSQHGADNAKYRYYFNQGYFLPSGYTQLDYIESTGTQYIDTLLTPTTSLTWTMDGLWVEKTSANQHMGSYSGNRFHMTITSGAQYHPGLANGYGYISSCDFARHKYTLSYNGYFSIDSTSYYITNWGGSPPSDLTQTAAYSIYLFALHGGSGAQEYSKFRMYSCQFYSGSTLVRYFIPCKNSSNVVGLYDFVEGKFYANKGTGSFTAGTNVSTSYDFTFGGVEENQGTLGSEIYYETSTYGDNPVPNFKDVIYSGYFKVKVQVCVNKYNVDLLTSVQSGDNSSSNYITAVINRRKITLINVVEYSSGDRSFADIKSSSGKYWYDGLKHGYSYTFDVQSFSGETDSGVGLVLGESIGFTMKSSGSGSITSSNPVLTVSKDKANSKATEYYTLHLFHLANSGSYLATNYTAIDGMVHPNTISYDTSFVYTDEVVKAIKSDWQYQWTILKRNITIDVDWYSDTVQESGYSYGAYDGNYHGVKSIVITNFISNREAIEIRTSKGEQDPSKTTTTIIKNKTDSTYSSSSYYTIDSNALEFSYYAKDCTYYTYEWDSGSYANYAGTHSITIRLDTSYGSNYNVVAADGLATGLTYSTINSSSSGVTWSWTITKRALTLTWSYLDEDGSSETAFKSSYTYNGSSLGVTGLSISNFVDKTTVYANSTTTTQVALLTSAVLNVTKSGSFTTWTENPTTGTTRGYIVSATGKSSSNSIKVALASSEYAKTNFSISGSDVEKEWAIIGRELTISVTDYASSYTYNGNAQGPTKITITNMPGSVASESSSTTPFRSSKTGTITLNQSRTQVSSGDLAGTYTWTYTITSNKNAADYFVSFLFTDIGNTGYTWKCESNVTNLTTTAEKDTAKVTWTINKKNLSIRPAIVDTSTTWKNYITKSKSGYTYESSTYCNCGEIGTAVYSGTEKHIKFKIMDIVSSDLDELVKELIYTDSTSSFYSYTETAPTDGSGPSIHIHYIAINANEDGYTAAFKFKSNGTVFANYQILYNNDSSKSILGAKCTYKITKAPLTVALKDADGDDLTKNTSAHNYYYNTKPQGLSQVIVSGIVSNDVSKMSSIIGITKSSNLSNGSWSSTTYTMTAPTDYTSSTCSVVASLNSSNYTMSGDTQYYWAIKQIPITYSMDTDTYTYDGTAHSIRNWTVSLGTITSGYTYTTVTVTADGTNGKINIKYDTSPATTETLLVSTDKSYIDAGTYTLTNTISAGSGTKLSNYSIPTSGKGSLKINPRPLTATWSANQTLTYNSDSQTLRTLTITTSASGNPFVTRSDTNKVDDPLLITIPSGVTKSYSSYVYTFAAEDAGSYTLKAKSNSSNYTLAETTATQVIDKRKMDVTWTVYKKTTATGTESVSTMPGSYDGNYYVNRPGLTAASGNTGYISGDDLAITLVTTKTADYDANFPMAYTATDGFIRNAGYYKFTASALTGSDKDNYELTGTLSQTYTQNRRALTVTVKEYGSSTNLFDVATAAHDTNITLDNKKQLFPFTSSSCIASTVYNGSNQGITVTFSNLLAGDMSSLSLPSELAGSAVTATKSTTSFTVNFLKTTAGTYSYQTYLAGDMSPNYVLCGANFSRAQGIKCSFKITQRPLTVSWTGATADQFTYSGVSQNLTTVKVENVVSGEKPVTVTNAGKAVNASGTTTLSYVISGTNAVTYNVVVTLTDTTNYTISGTLTDSRSIQKKDLTITANPKTITYGEPAANAGVTYSGFVNGETTSVLSGTLTYSYNTLASGKGTAYAQGSSVGTYYIIPDGVSASNYAITFVAGELTVEKREVTLTWYLTNGKDNNITQYTVFTQTYNTYDWTAKVTLGNIYGSDTVTPTYSGNSGYNATTYTAKVDSLSNANYKLPSTVTKSFEITKATIEVRIGKKGNTRYYYAHLPSYYYQYKINGASSYSTNSTTKAAVYEQDTIYWNASTTAKYLDNSTSSNSTELDKGDAGQYTATLSLKKANRTSATSTVTTSNYIFTQGTREDTALGCDLLINPVTLTLTWTTQNFTYDGNLHYRQIASVSSNATEGFITTKTSNYSVTQTANAYAISFTNSKKENKDRKVVLTLTGSETDAGSYTMTAAYTNLYDSTTNTDITTARSLKNFIIVNTSSSYSIAQRVVELVWKLDGNNATEVTYRGTDYAMVATVNNAVDGDTVNVTYDATNKSVRKDAGSYTTTVTGVSDDNYTIDGADDLSIDWTIKKKQVVVTMQNGQTTPANFTGGSSTRDYVYNGTAQGVKKVYITGLVNNEVPTCTSAALTGTASNSVVVTLSSTLTATATNNGSGSFTYTIGDTINAAGTNNKYYTINCTASNNYEWNTTATNFNSYCGWYIQKLTVTLKWTKDGDLEYSKVAKGITATVTGGLASENPVTITGSTTDITCSTGSKSGTTWTYKATAVNAKTDYTVTAELNNKTNYQFSTSSDALSTTFSITKKVVALTWKLDGTQDATEVTYRGTDYSMVATVNNFETGDTVGVTYSTTNISTRKNAGSYTTEVVGVDNDNYTIDGAENLSKSWKINKKKLTVTMQNKNGDYFNNNLNGTGSTHRNGTYTYNGSTQGVKTVKISGLVNGEVPTGVDTPTGTAANTVSITLNNLTATGVNSSGTVTYTISDTKDATPIQNNYYSISCAANTNYEWNTSASNYNYYCGWYIKPLTVTINWTADSDLVYSNSDKGVTAKVTGGLASENPVTISGTNVTCTTGTVSGTTWTYRATAINANNYSVTATLKNSNNYILSGTATKSFDITQRPLTVSYTNDTNLVYSKSAKGTTAKVHNALSSEEPVEFTLDPTTMSVGTGSFDSSTWTYYITGINAGSYKATPKLKESMTGNYTLTVTEGTFTITPYEVTLVWKIDGSVDADAIVVYDNKQYVVTAIATGPTTTGVFSGDTCTVTVTNDKYTVAGSYTTTATALSNSNYKLPSATTYAWTIQPRDLTVTWTPDSDLTYSNEAKGATLVVGNSITTNYEPVTVTINNSGTISTGTQSSRNWSYEADGINANTYTVTITLKDTANYRLEGKTTADTETFTIGKRTVLLAWSTTTTFTYNNALQGVTATITGGVDTEPVTITGTGLTIGKSYATADKTWTYTAKAENAGTYTATATENANYTLTFAGDNTASISFTIKPLAVTISWTLTNAVDGYEATYDKFTQTYNGYTWKMDASITNKYSSDNLGFNYSGNKTGKNAGSYTATVAELTGTDANNYTLKNGTSDVSNKSKTLTINKAALTITADNISVTYGAAIPTYTATYTGFVGEDSLDNNFSGTGTLSLSCPYAQGSNVGTYTITPSGLTEKNYAYTYVTGTLTVSKRVVTISYAYYTSGTDSTPSITGTSIKTYTKVYDGNAHGYTFYLSNLYSSEKLKLNYTYTSDTNTTSSKTISETNKGTYTISTFSISDNGAAKVSNYRLDTSITKLEWTISPLIVYANAAKDLTNTKVYDATTAYTGTTTLHFYTDSEYKTSTSLVGKNYTVAATYSDANVVGSKTINYTFTLTSENVVFGDTSLQVSEGSIPGYITARVLLITMRLGNNKIYKTYDGKTLMGTATYGGKGTGTSLENNNTTVTQRSTNYRAGQGFAVSNIPVKETDSFNITSNIAEVYNSSEIRTGFTETGTTGSTGCIVNLDAYVNNVVYSGTTLSDLSNFKVDSSTPHYKRIILTFGGSATKSNYVLSVENYTVEGDEVEVSSSGDLIAIIYDKADTVKNPTGAGWTISINKKTINASYSNTQQSYIEESTHEVKTKGVEYVLANTLGEYDSSKTYYTKSAEDVYTKVKLNNSDDFATYYVNTMYEEVECTSIGVVSGDSGKVGVTVANGWRNAIDTDPITKYTTYSGRANSNVLGAKLTKGTSTIDASVNYTLRNQPYLVIGYFVGYGDIDSLGSLLLATHYYTNYKNFTVGYTYGWTKVLTSTEYLNGLLTYYADSKNRTVTLTNSNGDSVSKTFKLAYEYAGNISAFVEGTTYYTITPSLVDLDDSDGTVDAFNSCEWYYTLEDGVYTVQTGLTQFKDNTTYYTLAVTETTDFTAGTNYYTASEDWNIWIDWYERIYEEVTEIEIELSQYDYIEGDADYGVEGNDGQWGYYVASEVKWSEGAKTTKYNEFVLDANISGIFTQDDIDLLDAEFGADGWGVGTTALTNFYHGTVGSMVTAIGSFFEGTFDGTFTGDGYTIDYINIVSYNNASSYPLYVGFFEQLGANAKVSGLNFRNTNIVVADGISTTKSSIVNVGGIAGASQSTTSLSDVSFHGSIVVATNGAKANVGGIIGTYTGTTNIAIVDGAIVAGEISVVIKSNTVDTATAVGSIVGNISYDSSSTAYLNDVVSVAPITVEIGHRTLTNTNVGAFIGSATNINATPIQGTSKLIANSVTLLQAIETSSTGNNLVSSYDLSNVEGLTIDKIVGNNSITTSAYALDYTSLRALNVDVLKAYTTGNKCSLTLNDIIDAYVLMNGMKKSGNVYVVDTGASWLVGDQLGTTSDEFIISSQQNVSLLRMIRFASFSVANSIKMAVDNKDSLYWGTFYGEIISSSKITLRVNNNTEYDYDNGSSTVKRSIIRYMFAYEKSKVNGTADQTLKNIITVVE